MSFFVVIFGYVMAAVMGLVLGMMGAGGSILTVPILHYIFGYSAVAATTSSLFIVGTVAMIGAASSIRSKEIKFSEALTFAGPGLVGIFISRYLLVPHFANELVVLGLFSCFMILSAVSMLRKKALVSGKHPTSLKVALYGNFVGLLTGFVGAGGGFFIVPVLANLLKFSMKQAIATSLLIITLNSYFGFAISAYAGAALDWIFLFKFLAFAVFGLLIGIKLKSRINEVYLKREFAVFILLAGISILGEQISKLL